jgi:alkyl hydroperoxide reductase subunit F
MNKIEIFTKSYCPYCVRAKSLLDGLDLSYTEYELTFDRAREAEMIERSGRFTVPQIFVNGRAIGGSDELVDMVEDGSFFDRLQSLPGIVSDNSEVSSHV